MSSVTIADRRKMREGLVEVLRAGAWNVCHLCPLVGGTYYLMRIMVHGNQRHKLGCADDKDNDSASILGVKSR